MKGELRVLFPGNVLFKEGDQSDGLFFIREGKIVIYRIRDGLEIELAELGPGDVIGTATVVSNDPRTACARAVTQSQVMFVSSGSLESSMKTIPVWTMALLKDAIARLKDADSRLCSATLRERELKQQVGTPVHHGAQFAAYLSALMRLGTIEDDGIKMFPLRDVLVRCESILMQNSEYWQRIIDAFRKSGLIKIVEDKKNGTSVSEPKPSVLDDFSMFCRQFAKDGKDKFVPIKFIPWMTALGRIRKKNPEKEFWPRPELAAEFDKDLGRTDSLDVLENLLEFGVIRLKSGSVDEVAFDAIQAQRRVVFESACRELLCLNAKPTQKIAE